jgi:SET domain-containing protein
MIQAYLYIAPSEGRGRGVYTREAIPADTIVEVSPVLVLSGDERKLLDQTLLHDYIFEWGELKDRCCVAWGFVSMYNHRSPSNCEYFMDYAEDIIFVKTVTPIAGGEELTINYNGSAGNTDPVWVDPIP